MQIGCFDGKLSTLYSLDKHTTHLFPSSLHLADGYICGSRHALLLICLDAGLDVHLAIANGLMDKPRKKLGGEKHLL